MYLHDLSRHDARPIGIGLDKWRARISVRSAGPETLARAWQPRSLAISPRPTRFISSTLSESPHETLRHCRHAPRDQHLLARADAAVRFRPRRSDRWTGARERSAPGLSRNQ